MAINAKYETYKWTIFVSMYIGYTLVIFDRKAFSFAAPAIMTDVGLEKNDLGLIASSQNMAYTISKFLGGLLSDRANPKYLFCIGLFLSGIVVISFTMFDSVLMFACLWFLCGLVQGGGWPACARILRQWFPAVEFGTWWSVMSTSMNLACSLGPMISTFIIVNFGWRLSMQIFGTLSLGMSGLCLLTLINNPEEVGITGIQTMAVVRAKEDKGRSRRGRGTWQDLIASPLMWVMGFGYMVVFMTRTAILDWSVLYLMQERNQSQYSGSMFISTLETGGIIGSIIAGYLGDKVVSMTKREDTRGTPRMWVLMGFVLLTIGALHNMLFLISSDSSQLFISASGFIVGFGLYGPVALYGVMAMEAAPSHLSGTAHAISGLSANIGAVMAGIPISSIAKKHDWHGAFVFLEMLLVFVLIIKILTRNFEYKFIPIKKKMQ